MEIRPLGFGEIFDRAVTLYVRNFVPIAAIVVVMIVPFAIFQYVVDSAMAPQMNAILAQAIRPNAATNPFAIFDGLLRSPETIAAAAVLLVASLLLWPFALNAVAVGVARLYRGRAIDFGSCYRASFARWPAVLGMLCLEFAMLVAWYIALLLVVIIGFGITFALVRASVALGIFAGILAGIAVLAAVLALAPLIIAITFAMYAIVIEGSPVGRAIGSGFARVFNRAELWRAVLLALATWAIVLVAELLSGVVVYIFVLLHLTFAEVAVGAIARAVIVPFSVVILAVYYFDVRIRREGFDLEAALERLTAP